MKGKSYTANTCTDDITGRTCYIIRPDGRADSRNAYEVKNRITTPGKQTFILYNPETGKTKRAKKIFVFI